MIANCGHDERGRYSGGKAGDQGGEYHIINWYSRPWDVVLRHPDKKVRERIAKIAREAANNNHIGYDQMQRLTYYNALKKAKWKPSAIKTNCETDCSASTVANVIAAGHQLGIEKLKSLSPNLWTGNMKSAFIKVGFKAYTSSKYTRSESYLLPGDILLNEAYHVAINLTKGSNAVETVTKVDVDGWWGKKTTTFTQQKLKTTVDGIVSRQPSSNKSVLPRASTGWEFTSNYSGGSKMVKAIQKLVGAKVDGWMGKKTVKSMQRYLGVTESSKLDEKTVKAWQKYLNK